MPSSARSSSWGRHCWPRPSPGAWRAGYRAWWFFFLYLLTVLAADCLTLLAPDRFHTPEFWRAKETAIAGLRFAMACEVGVRTMRAFRVR
jgi:hypothetical protein